MTTKFICFCPNTGVVRAWVDYHKYGYPKLSQEELFEITENFLLNYFENVIYSDEEKPQVIERAWQALQKRKCTVHDGVLSILPEGE